MYLYCNAQWAQLLVLPVVGAVFGEAVFVFVNFKFVLSICICICIAMHNHTWYLSPAPHAVQVSRFNVFLMFFGTRNPNLAWFLVSNFSAEHGAGVNKRTNTTCSCMRTMGSVASSASCRRRIWRNCICIYIVILYLLICFHICWFVFVFVFAQWA